MKLVCDADVDAPLVQHLRDAGHEVTSIADVNPGSTDEEVLEIANQRGAVLITRDKGFGQLVFQQRRASAGVLLIRLAGVPMSERKELLARVVADHGAELADSFSVLTRSRLRIRRRIL